MKHAKRDRLLASTIRQWSVFETGGDVAPYGAQGALNCARACPARTEVGLRVEVWFADEEPGDATDKRRASRVPLADEAIMYAFAFGE